MYHNSALPDQKDFPMHVCRSAVLAVEEDSKHGSALLFVRGGTTTLQRLLGHGVMPSNFAQVLRQAHGLHQILPLHLFQKCLLQAAQLCDTTATHLHSIARQNLPLPPYTASVCMTQQLIAIFFLSHINSAVCTKHTADCRSRTVADMQMVDLYASQSFRLQAIACGVIRGVAKLDLTSLSLQQLEKSAGHMDLLGLVVMSNHVRPDSKETVAHLQDR